LILCGKCKTRWYCSRLCQRQDWPTHKQTWSTYIDNFSGPDGQPLILNHSNVVGSISMHKDIRRIFAAMSEHAIFYLRIHRPLNTIYPHNIIGPFTRKEAFNHAHQQLRQLATELAHTELRSFVNEIDTALLSSEDKQQLKSMAEIREYRVHLPAGKTHTIRFHVEHNPAVVRLWRDIRAGTVEERPTY
jgi:hypothetical protein